MADSDIINSGRNDAGQFVSKQVIQAAAQREVSKAQGQVAGASAAVNKLASELKGLAGSVKKMMSPVSKTQKDFAKSYSKMLRDTTKMMQAQNKQVQKAYKLQNKEMRKQTAAQIREYRRLSKARDSSARGHASGGFLGGHSLGLGSLIGGAAVYGLARKLADMSNPLLSAEIGGRGSVAALRRSVGPNVPMSKGADLLGRYRNLGKAQFFDNTSINGLMRLQSELAKGAGLDNATQIVEDLTKSYGDATDRLQAFLKAAGTGDVQQVLRNFANGDNIQETVKALNALSIAGDKAKGTLDPMVSSQLTLTTTMDKLNATFETFVSDVMPKFLPLLEKGASYADSLAASLAKLDGSTLAMLGIGGVAAAVGGRAAMGGAARLAGRGLMGVGGLAAGAAGPIGAGIALGTGAAFGLDEGFGAGGSDPRRRAGAYGAGWLSWRHEAGVQQGSLSGLAEQRAAASRALRDNAKNPLDALRGQRSELAMYISKEVDPNKLADLQKRWASVNEQIRQLGTQAPQQTNWWDKISEAAKKAAGYVGEYGGKVGKLSSMASRQQQTRLDADVAGGATGLARARLDLARTSPFGQEWGLYGSMPEWRDLQSTIEKEVGRLQDYLKTIDQSTAKGAIEGMKTKTEIINLQTESKRNTIELLQGLNGQYLDAIGAAAIGAGKYEQFLITKEQNLGRGLREGMVKANPLVGSLTDTGMTSFQFSRDQQQNARELNKRNQQLMMRLPQWQQDALGSTTMQRPKASPAVQAPMGADPSEKLIAAGKTLQSAGEEMRADRNKQERPERSNFSSLQTNPF